jgi:protein MpaA
MKRAWGPLVLLLGACATADAQTGAPEPVPEPAPAPTAKPVPTASVDARVAKLCGQIDALYRRQKWGQSRCNDVEFSIFGESVEKRPLVQFEAGDATEKKRLTLVQCGIHGDELPTLPMCLNLIHEIRDGKRAVPKGVRLVVQPLLNPDGMFKTKPTRPNARGVDINRNFPTKDFDEKAVKTWKAGKDRGDPRKFPGHHANSEPETQAIVAYLEKHPPQKILAIHTPLGFLDLDARGDATTKRRAKYLAVNMSKNAGDYTFKSFGSFPGSLGNYAGNERKIPVYTLELPPGTAVQTIDAYWTRFRVALWRAIDFDLDTGQFVEED